MRAEAHPLAVAAERLANAVALPSPFTVGAFLHLQQSVRARPIFIHPVAPGWAGAARWCGAWIDAPDADHIVYVEDPASIVRNAGTVLHEAGHMLLDHPGDAMPSGLALPGVPRAAVRRARGRTAFDEPAEHAAELFASLVLRRSGVTGAITDALGTVDLLTTRLG